MLTDIQPTYDEHGVAWCSEVCPSHDGKRCKLIGFAPCGICELWAREAAKAMKERKTGDTER